VETCKYCNGGFSNLGGLSSHEPYCKENPQRKFKKRTPGSGAKPGSTPWNKGRKMSEEQKLKLSKALLGKSTGKGKTKEGEEKRRMNISSSMKLNANAGGLRRGSGVGKSGWYQGYWCDSTWELAWVIYNLEHKIKFERNKEGFEYTYKNNKHRYFPDFISDDIYYEIKGRRDYSDLDEKNKCKIDQFKKKLKVLYSSQMENILDYVSSIHGKNIENLYE